MTDQPISFSPHGLPETVLDPEPADALVALDARPCAGRPPSDATRCRRWSPAGRGSSTAGRASASSHATTSRPTRASASGTTAGSTGCGSRAGAAPATCAGLTRPIAASCARSRGCGGPRRRSARPTRSCAATSSSTSSSPTGTGCIQARRRGRRRYGGSVKRALVTGITGQDGRFLAQFLAGKGYQVYGLIRGQNNPKGQMVVDETPSLELVDGDLRDLSSLIAAVEQVQPDEVYNLGAVSFVPLSWTQPELTVGDHRPRRAPDARGGAHRRRHRPQPDPLLPGVVVGDVRQGARDPADTSSPRSTRDRPTASPRCSVTT